MGGDNTPTLLRSTECPACADNDDGADQEPEEMPKERKRLTAKNSSTPVITLFFVNCFNLFISLFVFLLMSHVVLVTATSHIIVAQRFHVDIVIACLLACQYFQHACVLGYGLPFDCASCAKRFSVSPDAVHENSNRAGSCSSET